MVDDDTIEMEIADDVRIRQMRQMVADVLGLPAERIPTDAGKNYDQIFKEFEGYVDPSAVQGSGDVKYPLGALGKYEGPSGQTIKLELAANPTGRIAYLRWMGPNRDIVDYSRIQVDRTPELESWAAVMPMIASRVRTAYGYVNNHFGGHSPEHVRMLQRMLGLPTVSPGALSDQLGLF